MRRIWLILWLWAVTLAQASDAHSVTLSWDPNVEPDVAGYIIYWGTNSGVFFSSVDVGNTTTTTIGNLTEGWTYYFVATAYNTSRLESGPSNEVSYKCAARAPPPPFVQPILDQVKKPRVRKIIYVVP